MIEINKIGEANGSALIMLAIFAYSLGVSKSSFEWTVKINANNQLPKLPLKLVSSVLLIVITSVLFLGLFIFLIYSGPVLKNVNRVEFWESMKSTGLSFFPTLVIQTFYFVAYYYLHRKYDKRKKRNALLFLGAYIIITALVLGEKFSAFIIYMSVFLALFPSFVNKFKLHIKYVFLGGGLISLLVIVIAFSYIIQGRDSSFIFIRAALQGQLMWSIFNESFPKLIDLNMSCFLGCNAFENGKEYISFKYLPVATYIHYKNTGTQLSGFAPALQLLTLGIIPTLFLQTFVSFLLGFLQARMVAYNSQRNFIMGFLLFKLSLTVFLVWYVIMFTAFTGGVLTIIAIVLYIILCKSTYGKKSLETSKHIA